MQFVGSLLSGAKTAITESYSLLGWDKLLLAPPADNPRNVLDYPLFIKEYRVGWVTVYGPGNTSTSDTSNVP